MAYLANTLSLLRMLLVPVALVLAWKQNGALLIPALGLALLTDVLDGLVARVLSQCTDLGRALDSWADFMLYMAAPLILWWYDRAAAQAAGSLLFVAVAAFGLPVLIGFLKYRRLTMYHTWGAKLMGVCMGMGGMALLLGQHVAYFGAAVAILVVSALEEVAITLLLPVWRAEIPSIWHAWRIRNNTTREGRGS